MMRSSTVDAGETWSIQSSVTYDGFFSIPTNAFLIRGKEPVLIDTSYSYRSEEFLATLRNLIDVATIRWVVVTHDDAEHIGNLECILKLAPEAKVLTPFIGYAKLRDTAQNVPLSRVHCVGPGESLTIADRTLSFFRPPFYDSCTTVGVLDKKTGNCFSSDCFGSIVPLTHSPVDDDITGQPEEMFLQCMAEFNKVNASWIHMVDRAIFQRTLEGIAPMAPKFIFSTHTMPIPGDRWTRLLATAATVPDSPPFQGPNQDAINAMRAAGLPLPL